jgi:metal-responsive CopG/Arc/MetJ family transcriptional regulator
MAENNLQVNVNFKYNPELIELLDQMVKEDDSDRSKFIRRLIMQESTRRVRMAEVREQGGHAPLEVETTPIFHVQG